MVSMNRCCQSWGGKEDRQGATAFSMRGVPVLWGSGSLSRWLSGGGGGGM